MANICDINIYVPLEKIPEEGERKQFKALFRAEKAWDRAVKKDKRLRQGKYRDEFIASQPDVPSELTSWRYSFSDKEVKNGRVKDGDLKPAKEQWRRPTIGAYFFPPTKDDRQVWVHPYCFGRKGEAEFTIMQGLTVLLDKQEITHIPMSRHFRWSFPWWAQVGFAGAKKTCNDFEETPKDPYEPDMAFLCWELPMEKVLSNLEYVIGVYEHFPVFGQAQQWDWVWQDLDHLQELYHWLKKIYQKLPEAKVILDWSEVAWGCMTKKEAQENDEPNQIMAAVKEMAADVQDFVAGKMTSQVFTKKHAQKVAGREIQKYDYVPICKRDPFNYAIW